MTNKKKIAPPNRRQFKRIRMDRSVRVPVHVFPKMPFIGESIEAVLSNISAGGMALSLEGDGRALARGTEIRIHFRLQGRSPFECRGVVSHFFTGAQGDCFVGVKFSKVPQQFLQELAQMSTDNDACDRRIETGSAWCVPTCAFHQLCRKPIRPLEEPTVAVDGLEIAFQHRD